MKIINGKELRELLHISTTVFTSGEKQVCLIINFQVVEHIMFHPKF